MEANIVDAERFQSCEEITEVQVAGSSQGGRLRLPSASEGAARRSTPLGQERYE